MLDFSAQKPISEKPKVLRKEDEHKYKDINKWGA